MRWRFWQRQRVSTRHALWCEFWKAAATPPTCTCGVFISAAERDRRTARMMRERGLSI